MLLPEYQGNQGCIYCHSSSTSSTTYTLNPEDYPYDVSSEIIVPVVVYTGATAPTDYLSGGNFWWVQTDDTKGHNIFDTNPDDELTSAPGRAIGCTGSGSCHDNLYEKTAIGPGGLWDTQACTSCHMVDDTSGPTGFHHADDSNIVVGSSDYDSDGYFRFLKGHMSGGHVGVCGIEDDDWGSTSSPTDHNEYLGYSGSKVNSGYFANFGYRHTMTAYCGGCHGNFHISSLSASGGDWIRHPAGAVLPDSGEIALYTIFDPDAPVARPDLTGWTGPDSTVTPGTDLVNCLSCHRAHGSPFPNMLRWDSTAADACATCHTLKVAETPGQYHVSDVAGCTVCHTSHGDGPPDFGPNENGFLVAEVISTPNSGDQNVVFPSGGANDFISGAPDYDGVCEVCHTTTSYHRNDSTGDHAHYATQTCTDCHSHAAEFGGAMPDDAPHHMHMDGTTHGPHDQECNDCHGVGGANELGAMVAAGACDNCHSPGGGYDGVSDPIVGAANNWTTLVRQPDGTLTPGKEKWCAGCHDSAPANSKSDGSGVEAPIVAGDGSTWGFYINGHGRSPLNEECIYCHDPSVDHIDEDHRTYAFDPSQYDPGESGQAYAAGYRLKYIEDLPDNPGVFEVPLMIPNDFRTTFGYNYSQHAAEAYRLCINPACHTQNTIFDNTPVGDLHDTNFMASGGIPHEEYPLKYSHMWGNGGDINDHVSHILHYIGTYWDSDWDTATTGTDAAPGSGADSSIACSSCHNVHGSEGILGSTNEAMIRNGNLTGRGGYGFTYLVAAPAGLPMVTSVGATRATSIGAVFRNDSGDMCIGCHGNKIVTTQEYDASEGGMRWGYDTYLEYYRPYQYIVP
jgi:predicted CXXCH cytochrome family protein